MSGLGVPIPRLRASAIAWSEAPVNTTGCIKPWAVPMVHLMYRLNLKRGINPAADWNNLTRPFQQDSDIAALNAMTVAERTFQLKLGSTNGNGNNPVNDSINTMPGNYQAVRLGKYWDASSGTYANPGPETGGNDYEEHVEGPECFGITVGDSLETEPGNKVGPTVDGAQMDGSTPPKGVCTIVRGYNGVDNTQNTDPSYGDCVDGNGNIGVDIKAAFYMCATGCNGSTSVEVTMLGSFTLMKVYPGKSKNGWTPAFDKAEIVGVFKPVQDTGPVGGVNTTLQRPILVR
jgi:hypothetical protein